MRTVVAACALALIATSALAQDRSEEAKKAAWAADVAFAARAAEVGTAKAFREYMSDPDSAMFGGGAEPARGPDEIYAAHGGDAPAKGKLEWAPVEAWGSAGGDMAVTTGKWTSTSFDAARPPRTGRYVSVWRKNAKGEWKAIVDIGNPDPPPTPKP
jgi:ketosteroid isomerase-like protein